jgi:hypothetical protein
MVEVVLLDLTGEPGPSDVGLTGKSAWGCLLVHMLPPYFDLNLGLYHAG